MAIDLTNVTAHFKFSDDVDVRDDWSAGGPPWGVGTVTDGNEVLYSYDRERNSLALREATNGPFWASPSSMSLPALSFNGTNSLMGLKDDTTATAKTLAFVGSSTAKCVIFAVRVRSAVTNAGAPYNSNAIVADGAGYWGVYVRDDPGSAGAFLQGYNYDGSVDKVEVAVSYDTDYIVVFRHVSGNMYLSVNNGTEVATATGTTVDTSGQILLGQGYGGVRFDGYIGEIIFESSGAFPTNNYAYMASEWFPPAGYTITADAGAFTLTGNAANLISGKYVAADVGAFTLTGNAASLVYSPVANYSVAANTGVFTMTGKDVGFLVGHDIAVGTGVFTMTGGATGLSLTHLGITANTGAFSFVGNQAGLFLGKYLSTNTGVFDLVGKSVALATTAASDGRASAADLWGYELIPGVTAATMMLELWRLNGLDKLTPGFPLVVNQGAGTRVAGNIIQTVVTTNPGANGITTVTRQ